MTRLRCGVIGVGYLGKFHAQKYKKLPTTELVAVADCNESNGMAVAESLGCRFSLDYRDILDGVDAVSIVVPTSLHHEVSKACIERGIHVLVEKPITSTVEEAKDLIALAKQHQVKLQVGHIERYNPAILSVEDVVSKPYFIQASRLAMFNNRIKDTNVILDLMIHDIELIRSWVRSPVKTIMAVGAPILSDDIDIANVHIEFEGGCVVDVTANRVSSRRDRVMRIFQSQAYHVIDLNHRMVSSFDNALKRKGGNHSAIQMEQMIFDESDPLLEEIKEFTDAILFNREPKVTGEMGCDALEIAVQISDLIYQRNQSLFVASSTNGE